MSSPATPSDERCLEALRTVSDLIPVLEAALVPEKREPQNRHAPPTEDQVAAYRAERAERHLLKTTYLPASQAPADLDIVMALADIKTFLTSAYADAMGLAGVPRRCRRCNHLLEEHGGNTAGCGLCDPCPGFSFTYVPPHDRGWRDLLAATPEVADSIEGYLQKAVSTARGAISDHETGQLIMAPCPWCNGVTPAMPEGSLTIKVFTSPYDATKTYALCMNPSCDPDAAACGARKGGRPMWPFHELGWLSARIDEALCRRRGAENAA